VRTEAEASVTEDRIADGELSGIGAERFDGPRELTAENRLARSAQARDRAADYADETPLLRLASRVAQSARVTAAA
jgi:hypothetical protein